MTDAPKIRAVKGHDPRKREVTITMTAEEWDTLASFADNEEGRMSGYGGSELRYQARHKIGEAVGSPRARFRLAKREVDSGRADVMGNLPAIKRAVRAYVTWWKKGEREGGEFPGVSHLGSGNPVDETEHAEPTTGFYVRMTPAGVLVFMFQERSFLGRYPYFKFTRKEEAALVELCGKVAKVQSHWNGYGTPSLSVSFGQIR